MMPDKVNGVKQLNKREKKRQDKRIQNQSKEQIVKKFAKKYYDLKKIGQGGFSEVYKAKDENGMMVAIKILSKKCIK